MTDIVDPNVESEFNPSDESSRREKERKAQMDYLHDFIDGKGSYNQDGIETFFTNLLSIDEDGLEENLKLITDKKEKLFGENKQALKNYIANNYKTIQQLIDNKVKDKNIKEDIYTTFKQIDLPIENITEEIRTRSENEIETPKKIDDQKRAEILIRLVNEKEKLKNNKNFVDFFELLSFINDEEQLKKVLDAIKTKGNDLFDKDLFEKNKDKIANFIDNSKHKSLIRNTFDEIGLHIPFSPAEEARLKAEAERRKKEMQDLMNNQEKIEVTKDDVESFVDWCLGNNRFFAYDEDKGDINTNKMASQITSLVFTRIAGTGVGMALISTGVLAWLGIVIMVWANTPNCILDKLKKTISESPFCFVSLDEIPNPTDWLAKYAGETTNRVKKELDNLKKSLEKKEEKTPENSKKEEVAKQTDDKKTSKTSNSQSLPNPFLEGGDSPQNTSTPNSGNGVDPKKAQVPQTSKSFAEQEQRKRMEKQTTNLNNMPKQVGC